ncbi:MAG: heme biosynthesis HemY N-terminal domain-containing protein [Nevskiales bacterium]|nr:heme biosynthesis HemY N-terminal domain-containing protein [Nevskiales bacterium]
MIRTLLAVVLFMVLGAGAAYMLRAENGYVLISFQDWVLETSLLGMLLGAVLLIAVVLLLARLIIVGVRLPGSVRGALERHRQDRARKSFESGMLNLLSGSWKRAEIELVRRAADHETPTLNYLSAARAAQQLGADARRDHYLAQVANLAVGHPRLEQAYLLTQAELQLERGELIGARQTAERLRERDPRNVSAIRLLAECLFRMEEWEALRTLLIDHAAAVGGLRRRSMLERALIERLGAIEDSARVDQLKALWQATPREARAWPAVRLQYARGLVRLNAQAEAAALAADALAQEWDADLAALYGSLDVADPVGQLASIEQWLTRYGERPELLVAGGRACLRNRLWGKARSYLDAVLKTAPSASAYLEMAHLCEQTQKPDEAQAFYKKGLESAARP